MDIYKNLYEIFAEFELDECIKNDTRLIESGLIDSMRIVYLLSEIEDRFCIEIPMEQVTREHFETIDNIALFINDILRLKGAEDCSDV